MKFKKNKMFEPIRNKVQEIKRKFYWMLLIFYKISIFYFLFIIISYIYYKPNFTKFYKLFYESIKNN
jgi:hypothetical protein